jgi:hypothetical protein
MSHLRRLRGPPYPAATAGMAAIVRVPRWVLTARREAVPAVRTEFILLAISGLRRMSLPPRRGVQ